MNNINDTQANNTGLNTNTDNNNSTQTTTIPKPFQRGNGARPQGNSFGGSNTGSSAFSRGGRGNNDRGGYGSRGNQVGGNRGRNDRGRTPINPGPKTNANFSTEPRMVRRTPDYNNNNGIAGALQNIEAIRNIKGTGIQGGNLAISHLNPVLVDGPKINTKSPQFFPDTNPVVKIIPIGGTNEVGLNMTAFECGDDIFIIDTGIGFGDEKKFPGVDSIAPDTSYLEANRHKIKGLIYTHGHLDHIGAAPYVLPKLGPVPIYSMPLTLALLKNRMAEFELNDKFIAKIIDLNSPLELGCFTIQFFRLNHSINDVVGLCVDTPMGRVIYTTDWKFDNTPYNGELSEYDKLAKYGQEGVRLLMTDSLGVLKPGKSISEMDVKKTMMSIFKDCKERVIVTSFASTIPRLQFAVDCCIKYNRKLALIGRSMVNNFNICFKLGYIKVPKGLVVDVKELANIPVENACMLMTGSQNEDMAALSRLSRDEHDLIKLQAGDSVIFSSRPIQGNETAVEDLIAKLSRKGVDVYSPQQFSTHVSGHACQDDLQLLFALTRPDYLQPIHGNHFIIRKTAELGMQMGIPFEHNLIGENGRITELRYNEVVVTEEVVNSGYLLVDGTSVGLVSEAVLEERRNLARGGTVVLVCTINKNKQLVAGPELISRGFVYAKSGKELFDIIKEEVKVRFANLKVNPNSATYFTDLRNQLKNITTDIIFEQTEKTPVVIPIVVQM
jgi:ribonuclease J